MGRRWTTNQYMARRLRRMERRAFNRMWREITHKPSSNKSRMWHAQSQNEPSAGIVLLVCAIIAVIFIGISLLFKVSGILGCVVMVLFILFLISH